MLRTKLVPYEEEKHAEIISFDQSTREIVNEKRKEYLQNALLRLPPSIARSSSSTSSKVCPIRNWRWRSVFRSAR